MGQLFIYPDCSTYFIAVPCRCALRGGYIELVRFNDQLRSRVKTYLSVRSCPSTIGQVQIMYHMKWDWGEVPNERAASNPSPQFPVWIPGKTSVNTFRESESIFVLLRWFINISHVLDKPGYSCFSFRYIGFAWLFVPVVGLFCSMVVRVLGS